MQSRSRKLSAPVIWAWSVVVAVEALRLLGEWTSLVFMDESFFDVAMAALTIKSWAWIGGLFFLLVTIWPSSMRRLMGANLVLVIGIPAFSIAGMMLTSSIGPDTAKMLEVRAQPIVAAIDAYELEYGKPPKSLDGIVPKYLPVLPALPAAFYPPEDLGFSYILYSNEDWCLRSHMRLYGWPIPIPNAYEICSPQRIWYTYSD